MILRNIFDDDDFTKIKYIEKYKHDDVANYIRKLIEKWRKSYLIVKVKNKSDLNLMVILIFLKN